MAWHAVHCEDEGEWDCSDNYFELVPGKPERVAIRGYEGEDIPKFYTARPIP